MAGKATGRGRGRPPEGVRAMTAEEKNRRYRATKREFERRVAEHLRAFMKESPDTHVDKDIREWVQKLVSDNTLATRLEETRMAAIPRARRTAE